MGEEKSFENKIKRFLDSKGVWYVKFFANGYTKIGVPDILACVNGYFVGIEVKARNGRPSELQQLNIKKIRDCGGFAVIVYPTGFEELKRLIEDLQKDIFNRDMDVVLK